MPSHPFFSAAFSFPARFHALLLATPRLSRRLNIMNTHQGYSAVRAPGHEHIPLYPRGFIALRIVQLVFAVLLLALAAYGVSGVLLSSIIFTLVVALFTLVASIYHLVVEFAEPAGYNYWAVLGLDIFLVIMWLSDFAAVGADASAYRLYYYRSTYYYHSWYSLMAAGAALGALEFILHTVSLVIHSIKLHQHRKAGLHCKPGSAATLPIAMVTAPSGGEEPAHGYFAQPPYVMQQPAPTYQQQLPQSQTPTSAQPTGGSFQQQPPQQPYYQQGSPVPLFTQTTGGSTLQEQQQQPPTPQVVTPQSTWSELGSTQQLPTPQPTRFELGNTQHRGEYQGGRN
ncbi:hypothetical protein B0H67DRAFT_559211 [Lasiosphaeris hirsuta]|uniref:MARVEL domain-containing protein n=1 Tax=Lasiosphaeris hirsuta TaxID=260670 RepID=A0AA40B8G9_9PEZI|nr:hypothetical protein B0H67DRAFT_559211 [Lasiosphaeris hirsuta]